MLKLHFGQKQVDVLDSMNSLARIPSYLLEDFTAAQLDRVEQIIKAALPKPAPKLVDLRIDVNLVITRFYVVIFIGKERRKQKRKYLYASITKLNNLIMTVGILTGINLTFGLIIFVILYLFKSWLDINILKEIHLIDVMNHLLG